MADTTSGIDERYQWVVDMDLSRTSSARPVSPAPTAQAPSSPSTIPQPGLAETLARVPLFNGFRAPQLQKLLRLCTPVAVAQTERACTMGEPSDCVLILLSGELQVLMDDDVAVATVRPVTTLGEMGYVTRWPRTVSLVAVEDCSLMMITNVQLHALLQSDRDLHLLMLENIVAIMAERIGGLNDHMRRQLRNEGR